MRLTTSPQLGLLLGLVVPTAVAYADPAPSTDSSGSPTTSGDTATIQTAPEPNAEVEVPVEYGIGIRARSIFVPKAELDLFLDQAPGGVQNYGTGVELIRRRGNTELQLGFEFEHVQPTNGIYINKGDVVPTSSVDYLLSPEQANGAQFGWFTIDFTFIHHAEITNWLAFRYGAGLGLGITTGSLEKISVFCTNTSTNENTNPGCIPSTGAPNLPPGGQATMGDPSGTPMATKYDMPPVFPVVNAIIGFQFRPTDKLTVNIEGGLRTVWFYGLDVGYFF